ncbi:MAG: hypothetical protein CMQ41_07955 [Gammaproteobacteria bacterium]|mgnify:CR=1 FL=1|nr:hypothetical protein [Gammaproteobacteria bacterium]|tara:strand:+ start:585 stop:839 length:255 start_codon:yes stop_codon:yes gene_type:complete
MQKKKELLVKALIWRFCIAIPFGMGITYLWLNDLQQVTELTITINIVSTVLYYLYDLIWSYAQEKNYNNGMNSISYATPKERRK